MDGKEKERDEFEFEIGDQVWVIDYYGIGDKPVLATLTARINGDWEPIYTVEYEGRKYDVLTAHLFDHEPRKVTVHDDMGGYTEWR